MRVLIAIGFTTLLATAALAQSQDTPLTIFGNADRSRVLPVSPLLEPPQTTLWKSTKLFQFRPVNMAVGVSGPIRFAVDVPTNHWVSQPIVSNGMIVFVFNADSGFLYVLDAATGRETVVLKFKDIRISAPAVRGSQIFFGDSKGVVHAFDVATRGELWSYEQKGSATAAPPLIDDECLYIHLDPVGLHAIDLETGAVRWLLKSKLVFGFALSGDRVVMLTEPGALMSIDRKTGAKLWEIKAGSDALSPVIMGDQVFVRVEKGEIRAYSLADGSLMWKVKPSGGAGSVLAAAKQLVFFTGREYNILAIDAATGAERWKFKTNHRCSNPVIAGDLLYASCADKKLYAIELLTGKEVWRLDNKSSIPTPPSFANGVMYMLGLDGYMYAAK